MKKDCPYTTFGLWRAWLRSFDLKANEVAACMSVIGACIAMGLLTLKIPTHRAFHRARIKAVTMRLGSSRPGASLFVELPDGRRAMVDTIFLQQQLAPETDICVQELNDAIRGGAWFQHTTPDRCLSSAPTLVPGLVPALVPAIGPTLVPAG